MVLKDLIRQLSKLPEDKEVHVFDGKQFSSVEAVVETGIMSHELGKECRKVVIPKDVVCFYTVVHPDTTRQEGQSNVYPK